MKKTFSLFICSMLSIMCFTSPILANEDTLNEQNLTEEQKEILETMPEREQEYLDYGFQAPIYGDFKNPTTRSATGSWSWRDGVICVTTEGFGTNTVNTWHSAIVAPQRIEAVIEAQKPGKTADFRHGVWTSSTHTIWQVGVKSTTVNQDYNAGYWADSKKVNLTILIFGTVIKLVVFIVLN